MRLENLREYDQPNRKTMRIVMDGDLYQALVPYVNDREASGFIRLAIKLLLALTGDEEDMSCIAEQLLISCATPEDVGRLGDQLQELAGEIRLQLFEILGFAPS